MTKLSAQYMAILFAGYDISGRSRQIDVSLEYEEQDATAFQDGVVNSEAGLAVMDAAVVTFMDPDTDESLDALDDPAGHSSPEVLMILIGQGAVPDEGDPGLAAMVEQFTFSWPVTPKEKIVANAKFLVKGNYVPQWGRVLDYATITDSKTCDVIDLGDANSNGANAYLVVFTPASSDSYTLKVQHNTVNNGSWVDYLTFSADGQSRTTERKASSSTINRYVRLLVTRTGSAGDDFGYAVLLCEN